MKFTDKQNEARKQFVISLLKREPQLMNVDVQERVFQKYGIGMVSERITDFRKLAVKSAARDAAATAARKTEVRGAQVARVKVTIDPTVQVDGRVARRPYNLIERKLPVEVQSALVALKASVRQFYRAGGLSMNLGDSGELQVKYEFEPKDNIRGEVNL